MKSANTPIVHTFIDAQNMHRGISSQGWKIDFFKFRKYLADKYGVTHAYFFIGYVQENQKLYDVIQQAGFILQFKQVSKSKKGEIKGNVDVNLAIHVIRTLSAYDEAILITADGDFAPLVDVLKEEGKFRAVLSPAPVNFTSWLLKKSSENKIAYMDALQNKISK